MRKVIAVMSAVACLLLACGTPNTNQTEAVEIEVGTARCQMCVGNITKAVETLDGVQQVEVDLDTKVAHVKFLHSEINMQSIELAIASAGYDANETRRSEDAYGELPVCCQ